MVAKLNRFNSKPEDKIRKIKPKTKTFILIGLMLLVSAGVISLFVSGFINNIISPSKNQSQQVPKAAISGSNPVAESVITGDYSGGEAILDKAIAATNNIEDQAWIYIQKSSVAINLGHYNDAYDFAKKAEALVPTESSAQMIAAAAAKLGNKDEAISEYKIAISRITGASGMDEADRNSLQEEINLLGK